VLILREKTILVDGRPVKLYSLDGRLWFSRAADMEQFKRRRASVKASLQHTFASNGIPRHIPSGIVDFWS